MLRTADHDSIRRELRRRGYGIFRTRDHYHGERAAHHHDFYEVFLIWSGSLHYRVEDRSYHMTNGDILLIPPGEQPPAPAGDGAGQLRTGDPLDRPGLLPPLPGPGL